VGNILLSSQSTLTYFEESNQSRVMMRTEVKLAQRAAEVGAAQRKLPQRSGSCRSAAEVGAAQRYS